MIKTGSDKLSTELTPLGNVGLFCLFLIVGLMPVLISGGMHSVVEKFIADHDGIIGKMRVMGWARLLSIFLLLPFYIAIARFIINDNKCLYSNLDSLKICLAVTPLILLLAYLLMGVFQVLGSSPGQEHPLVKLFRSGRPMDCFLVLCLVLFAAPITEEVMFRGLFQQWIVSATNGPLLGWLMSLALVGTHGIGHLNMSFCGIRFWAQASAFLILGAIFIWTGLKYSQKYGSIFSGALVFAAVHSFAWPSPAGLLPLSLGLGWLRETTGRIWPCIIVHAAFNGFGSLIM